MSLPGIQRFERILFVESGPRTLGESGVTALYAEGVRKLDILTCFQGPPATFDPARGLVLSVHCQEARTNRLGFVRRVSAERYDAVALLSAGSRILQPWKVMFALRNLQRLVLVDEDGRIIPFRVAAAGQLGALLARRLTPAKYRSGDWGISGRWSLPEAMLSRAAEMILMPLEIAYLAAFTLRVHSARRVRLAWRHLRHS